MSPAMRPIPSFCRVYLAYTKQEREGITMKKGLTELVFILDRSGSMAGLEKDTIGGFNGMLKKQKRKDGEANGPRPPKSSKCAQAAEAAEEDGLSPPPPEGCYAVAA